MLTTHNPPKLAQNQNFLKKVGVRHIWGLTHWNTMTLGRDELFEFVTSSSHFVTLFTL